MSVLEELFKKMFCTLLHSSVYERFEVVKAKSFDMSLRGNLCPIDVSSVG